MLKIRPLITPQKKFLRTVKLKKIPLGYPRMQVPEVWDKSEANMASIVFIST